MYGAAVPSTTAFPNAGSMPVVHVDLTVAATNQVSWNGSGTRGASDYCDKITYDATTLTSEYEVNTLNGDCLNHSCLIGTTKCTYIFTTAATIGAPAF